MLTVATRCTLMLCSLVRCHRELKAVPPRFLMREGRLPIHRNHHETFLTISLWFLQCLFASISFPIGTDMGIGVQGARRLNNHCPTNNHHLINNRHLKPESLISACRDKCGGVRGQAGLQHPFRVTHQLRHPGH